MAPDGTSDAPSRVSIAEVKQEVKLDLGAGENPREGFESVDKLAPNAKHKLDLLRFPWPWADSSVDELHCSHFIEHIPMEYVPTGLDYVKTSDGLTMPVERAHAGKDLLEAFFDECYRILKPGGKMHVIWPDCKNERAFQDPTHRRFIPRAFLYYLSKSWREQNNLSHCHGDCDFGFTVNWTMLSHEGLRHPSVQSNRINDCWNVAQDNVAMLVSQKPEAK